MGVEQTKAMNAESKKTWEHRLERLHQGQLTPEEVAVLKAEAMSRSDAESTDEELALEEVLARLPRPPVSSNFTSQVLEAIRLEQRQADRTASAAGWGRWRELSFWWRIAVSGGAMMLLGMGLMFQIRTLERQRRAETLLQVVRATEAPEAARLPAVETFRDFEAIQLSAPQARLDYVGLVAALSE